MSVLLRDCGCRCSLCIAAAQSSRLSRPKTLVGFPVRIGEDGTIRDEVEGSSVGHQDHGRRQCSIEGAIQA